MKITSLKDAIVETCNELFPMFGINQTFIDEVSDKTLNSCEQVNVLVGLTQGLKGNIVVGLPDAAALKIVSAMMCGMEITEIDVMAKSALSEFTNMLCGNMVSKLNSEEIIDISPPTIVTGDNMYLMISRAPSKIVQLKLADIPFSIAYCIE